MHKTSKTIRMIAIATAMIGAAGTLEAFPAGKIFKVVTKATSKVAAHTSDDAAKIAIRNSDEIVHAGEKVVAKEAAKASTELAPKFSGVAANIAERSSKIKLPKIKPAHILATGGVVALVGVERDLTATERAKANAVEAEAGEHRKLIATLPVEERVRLAQEASKRNSESAMSKMLPSSNVVGWLAFFGLCGFCGLWAFKIWLSHCVAIKKAQAQA